jgi:2-octaprenylphenol hydroxylase
MTSTNHKFDVLIVGAGMVGAAFACALGDSRLKVAVLDSRAPAPPTEEYDLRVSAITLASRALFGNLGVWEAMRRRRVSPVEAMQIWESDSELRFDAADIGEPCLAYIIENSVIQQALIERLHAFTNVQCLWSMEIESIAADEDGARVRLRDGRCFEARLLIGADGAQSAVRRAAGIEVSQWDVEQQGIVATVRAEGAHAHTAYQHFLPGGPLAFLPLAEPHTCSIVWSADTARAEALMALDDAAFSAELRAVFGDRLGRVVLASRRQAFPLVLAHARAYIAARVALIGDAAHTVHPLAGQGVNLGLMDAAVLAELVREAAVADRDIGAYRLLRRYERARKAENLGMVALTGGFKYLFGMTSPLVRSLRRAGLGVADAAGPLKRALIRRASGLEGDLPGLAREKPGSKR